MPRSCSDSYFIQLVYEYLLHMGLDGTAALFKEECNASNLPLPDEPDGVKRGDITGLLQLFDDEHESLFFKAFNSVIPKERHQSNEYIKLMVDLLVYFAALSVLKQDDYEENISLKPLVHLPPQLSHYFEAKPEIHKSSSTVHGYHAHTNPETLERINALCNLQCEKKHCTCSPPKPGAVTPEHHPQHVRKPSALCLKEGSDGGTPANSSMCRLLTFLKEECSHLREDPYFLPYFSLPFAQHPENHPRFKHFFQDSWAVNLRKRLWDFLVFHRQAAKIPDIVLLSINEVPNQQSHSRFHHCSEANVSCSTDHGKSKSSWIFGRSRIPNSSTVSKEIVPDQCVPSTLGSVVQNEIFSNVASEPFLDDCSSVSDSTNEEGKNFEQSDNTDRSNKFHEFGEVLERNRDVSDSSFRSCCHVTPYTFIRESQSRPILPKHLTSMIKPAVQAMESEIQPHNDTHTQYVNLKVRYHQLHRDYHNLIGVAAELTGALENCLRGHQVDLDIILNNCIYIFPELFHHISDTGYIEREASTAPRQIYKLPEEPQSPSPKADSPELDVELIKSHLNEGNVKIRLLLLQALRWRITRKSTKEMESTLRQCVESDVLELSGACLLEGLLMPAGVLTPHPLQQACARFINTLASLRLGRDYLAQSTVLVTIVCNVLKQMDGILIDSVTRDMLVASLQKLSLREKQRNSMIQLGLVEWLVERLSNAESHRPYALEYSTALLMNLCLHFSAKERCIPIAESVLTLLMGLLTTPFHEALPYVNGTLYSLITHPHFNQAAARLDLDTALEDNIMIQRNSDIQKQMEHILLYHRNTLILGGGDALPNSLSEGETVDEDTEEIDLLEEELDENDPVRKISGEMCGETLLRAHYSLPISSPDRRKDFVPVVKDHSLSAVLIRPTTPHHLQNASLLNSEDSEGVVTAKESKGMSRPLRDARRKSSNARQATNKSENTGRQSRTLRRSVSSKRSFFPKSSPFTAKAALPKEVLDHHGRGVSSCGLQSEEEGKHIEHAASVEPPASIETPEEVPKITIDYASAREISDENDSEDVEVGAMPLYCLEKQSFDETGDNRQKICDSSGTLTNEAGSCEAFASKPKIPRTPPHLI